VGAADGQLHAGDESSGDGDEIGRGGGGGVGMRWGRRRSGRLFVWISGLNFRSASFGPKLILPNLSAPFSNFRGGLETWIFVSRLRGCKFS